MSVALPMCSFLRSVLLVAFKWSKKIALCDKVFTRLPWAASCTLYLRHRIVSVSFKYLVRETVSILSGGMKALIGGRSIPQLGSCD